MRSETASAKVAVAVAPLVEGADRAEARALKRTGSDRVITVLPRSGPRVSVLVLADLAVRILVALAFFGLGGLPYYVTPLALRGAQKARRLLRPFGTAGLVFGTASAHIALVVHMGYTVQF